MRSLKVFVAAAVVAGGILTIPLMAGASGGAAFQPPTPLAVALSATGPDQLQSAAAGPNGTFYVAGFAAATVTGSPRNVVVVKLTKTGRPDRSFGGGDGIATTALDFRGGNSEIGIGVQQSGKIVISATVANAAVPADRDVAVARLNPNGTLDRTFADGGVRVLDLNSAIVSGATVTGADAARGLAFDATGRIYIIGLQRGEGQFGGGQRTDTDFVITRLSQNGAVDRGFGTGGKHLLDIRGTDANRTPSSATPHSVKVLADGSVIGGGYAATAGMVGAQPVLYKLDTRGRLVTAFANQGVFHEAVLALQTEIYGMALHRTHVVTAGYGRDSGDQNDWVSMRFNVATGNRDQTWGGAPKGGVTIDPSGNKVGDNCRNAIALPGGKTILVGSTGPGGSPARDAAFAVLNAAGRPDTAYGDGVHVYAFGGGAGGEDQFWGGAVSGSNAIVVGWRGGGAAQTEATNDDAYAVIVPLSVSPLAALTARVGFQLDRRSGDAFEVKATFRSRNGFRPARDDLVLELEGGTGAFSTTIPAGSFKKNKKELSFAGTIDGVRLEVSIVPLGGNRFELTAAGKGASLRGLTNPVRVTLMIGSDGGTTRVAASRK